MSTRYPWLSSSFAQRSGAPLERGPRPLQSCTITTAGNGPGPSGFDRVTGICSENPPGAVVVIEGPTNEPLQALRAAAEITSAATVSGCRRLGLRPFYA